MIQNVSIINCLGISTPAIRPLSGSSVMIESVTEHGQRSPCGTSSKGRQFGQRIRDISLNITGRGGMKAMVGGEQGVGEDITTRGWGWGRGFSGFLGARIEAFAQRTPIPIKKCGNFAIGWGKEMRQSALVGQTAMQPSITQGSASSPAPGGSPAGFPCAPRSIVRLLLFRTDLHGQRHPKTTDSPDFRSSEVTPPRGAAWVVQKPMKQQPASPSDIRSAIPRAQDEKGARAGGVRGRKSGERARHPRSGNGAASTGLAQEAGQ
ncbi:predicted protein [Histoplasma mississippiense (nom. inval.)]|uniref:predicted protein n=1 Tax=Ajellomyces capsulatus (strain NAm1 / WU24) TaxID=2059318 RepID=UPI000157C00F|nr:predicted protein [Histoplasma mississippiense (nom. inval.)]EDN06850.1 predicted protein [Histoplasma mississippiense (nom. inval.)]